MPATVAVTVNVTDGANICACSSGASVLRRAYNERGDLSGCESRETNPALPPFPPKTGLVHS